MTDIDKQISIAKIGIMTKPQTVFLSTVCCSLKTVVDGTISTATTDGKTIKINPAFFLNLDKEEQQFLLAHETLHVVYMHMLRRGNRDATLFNYAADYVINDQLINSGFKFIKGGRHDLKYKGMSTEEVYELLEKNQNNNNLPDSILDGDIQENPDLNSSEIEQKIQDILVQAKQTAEMNNQAGSIPKSIERYLEELTKPKVNWKIVLRRFMQSLDNQDYTWRRPNKRYLPIYLPKLYSESLDKITFAIDTSGSVSDGMFNQFLSEVASVLRILKPKELELIQFDYGIKDISSLNSIHDLKTVKFTGHGGTNPREVLEHFNNSNSKGLIMLTDGYFFTAGLPDVKKPVFWAIFNNKDFEEPYGKSIYIEDEL